MMMVIYDGHIFMEQATGTIKAYNCQEWFNGIVHLD